MHFTNFQLRKTGRNIQFLPDSQEWERFNASAQKNNRLGNHKAGDFHVFSFENKLLEL